MPLDRLRSLGLSDRVLAELEPGEEALFGRVASEHRGRYVVSLEEGDVRVVPPRNEDVERAAVGDWVVLRETGPDTPHALARILPRTSQIVRKAPGKDPRPQTVVANVDVVLVVTALGRDVNERRLERFVTVVFEGGARPVVVLNKSDLVDDPAPYVERVRSAAPGVEVVLVSALTGAGLDALDASLGAGTTVALVGTSGAGKSTLVNRWLGAEVRPTSGLDAEGKGRHTTTSRAIVVLPGGAVVVDTPGLREVGLWSVEGGLGLAFPEIAERAAACRFADCQHRTEPGCAVLEGLAAGAISPERLASWRRLLAEHAEVESQRDGVAQRARRGEQRVGARALRRRLRDKGRR